MDILQLDIELPDEVFLWTLFVICLVIVISEAYKYMKYRAHSDILDLSIMGLIFLGIYIVSNNLLLAILATILLMMLEGAYEVRENPVWLRLVLTFTATYAWMFINLVLSIVLDDERWFGLGLNGALWVMLIMGFIFFGRKYIVVSRFMSPQYVYLFLFGVLYLVAFGGISESSPLWDARYFLVFGVNIVIYLGSGPLLKVLFGIKTLEDERALSLVEEVRQKFDINVRHIGIVEAPIINAFAYGPYFDRRIALIVEDINKFTDEEIRGIVAHELAHAKRNHTMWLLALGFVELMIKLLAEMPATGYDYLFSVNNPDYIVYYIFNISVFAVLVIFVRIMEGSADRLSRQKGYGKELAQSLYRLESFYQGIAGDVGLDAQLLSKKERTRTDEIYFAGRAAESLHQKLMKPSRFSLLFNLIASHPPTAFRLASIVDEDISPTRLSFFSFTLALPFFRRRNIEYLRRNREKVAELIQGKFERNFDSTDAYVELLPEYNVLRKMEGKPVVSFSRYDDKPPIKGTLVGVNPAKYVTMPIEIEIETADNTSELFNLSDWSIRLADQEHKYILKKQQKAKLVDITNKNDKIRFHYEIEHNGSTKTIQTKYLGVPMSMLPTENNHIIINSRGNSRVAQIVDFEEKNRFWKSKYTLTDGTETISIPISEFIIEMPPILIMFAKKVWEQQRELLKELMKAKSVVKIYTNQDLEIGVPSYIEDISNTPKQATVEEDIITISFGEERRNIRSKDLESMFIYYPWMQFLLKREHSFVSKFAMKLQNRGSTMRFVFR